MTPEQQLTAIGKACGLFIIDVPFTTDLNACHEMEKTLADDTQLAIYGSWLNKLCDVYPRKTMLVWSIRATAGQRAEAFLRTIGKWEEDGRKQPFVSDYDGCDPER